MDEPISEIKQLNDLREKVLRGEEVSPEEFHAVLLHVRKLRRDRKETAAKETKTPVDVAALLFGQGQKS